LSGFAGVFYAAKLSLVSPENFGLVVSITVLVMVVVGGMGSIPGAIVGALAVYYMLFALLPGMSPLASAAASSLGLGWLDQPSGNWPGIGVAISEMKYLVFGILLLGMILLRPEGLIPTRIRHDELKNLDQRVSSR
jgi:branched-chain amino acid transport system permease protein